MGLFVGGGAVAQLGERLNGIQEVARSIRVSSTNKIIHLRRFWDDDDRVIEDLTRRRHDRSISGASNRTIYGSPAPKLRSFYCWRKSASESIELHYSSRPNS